MTLHLLENWEGLDSLGDKYSASSGTGLSTSQARSGTRSALSWTSTGRITMPFGADITTGVFGAAMFMNEADLGTASYLYPLLRFSSGGTVQFSLTGTPNNGLRLYRYSTYVAASPAEIYKYNRWSYLEVKFNVSNSIAANSFQIYSDGNLVWTIPTGSDTQASSALTNVNVVELGCNYSAKAVYWDDIYVLDFAGSVNNARLGPIGFATLKPSGNGNYSQLTGSDADSVDNYLHVDETPNDGDASYVEGTTAALRDSYALDNLPAAAASVVGVSVNAVAKKDDVGAKTGKLFVRSNGADDDGTVFSAAETYTEESEIWEEDPDTSSLWTPAGVNALEAGIKVEA